MGRSAEAFVNGVGDQLDMAQLFGCNARDQIIERLQFLFAAEIEGLKQIVVKGGHFAELSAHQLLNSGGGIGIRTFYFRNLDCNLVESFEHNRTSL
ncbi:hypothetical protein D3C81_2123410 [compost metagenome]